MNNLKLQNKILLILLLPIISIIVLSINSLYIKYEEKNSMSKTINYLEFVMKTNSFLSQLQKERSYSINYISSYGNNFKDELSYQIEQSDKYKKLYTEFTQEFDANNYDEKLVPKISKVLKEIKQLNVNSRIEIEDLEEQLRNITEKYESVETDEVLIQKLDYWKEKAQEEANRVESLEKQIVAHGDKAFMSKIFG